MIELKHGLQVLNSFRNEADNSVLLQLGDVINDDTESVNAQVICPLGFYSVPADPIAGKIGAEVTVLQGIGNRDYVIGGRDPRTMGLLGQIKPGETCVYNTSGAANRTVYKNNGTIITATTDDNTNNGKLIQQTISSKGFQIITPWGSLTFDERGFRVTTASGASFTLGTCPSLGLPITPMNFCNIQADAVTVRSGGAVVIDSNCINLDGTTVGLGRGALGVPGAPSPASVVAGVTGVSGAPSTCVFVSMAPIPQIPI